MFHGELLNTEKHAKYWKHIIQWRSLPGPLALAVDHGVIGPQVLAKHTRLGSCCSALATSGFQCYIMFSNSIYIYIYIYVDVFVITLYHTIIYIISNGIHYVILYSLSIFFTFIPTLSHCQKTRNHSLILIAHSGSFALMHSDWGPNKWQGSNPHQTSTGYKSSAIAC